MAKMTKTQARNLLHAIHSKSFKLMGARGNFPVVLTVADYSAIQKICDRALKRVG